MRTEQTEILVIGAGPAGAVAAGFLRQQGRQVLMIEKEQFPRFSIGESLLPQSMEYIERAGMLQSVIEYGFQYKNGAAFVRADDSTAFDFRKKFSPGWGTTYQVVRADFDKVLADCAEQMGTEVRYRHEVIAIDIEAEQPVVTVKSPDGEMYSIQAKFLLDASGFGRILPRLLKLESPSNFPVRGAIFTHVQDNTPIGSFDRNKILVTVHPEHCDVWYWTIPFSNGRCSLGVVAKTEYLDQYKGSETERLQQIVAETPTLAGLLKDAEWDTPARQIVGYSANVGSLYGKNYALLGNAGEFLDPVFSSGVTIAFKSAYEATKLLDRHLNGESVNWKEEYEIPVRAGVNTFRAFVESWYAGGFQRIIFNKNHSTQIREMICSILAGYAWDLNNPYVADTKRRLTVLEEICA